MLKVIKEVRGDLLQWIKKEEQKEYQKLWIETHPHRAALQADLQQNNVHNPFSQDSKDMILELIE